MSLSVQNGVVNYTINGRGLDTKCHEMILAVYRVSDVDRDNEIRSGRSIASYFAMVLHGFLMWGYQAECDIIARFYVYFNSGISAIIDQRFGE